MSSRPSRRGSAFAWAVIDTLCALLLVIYVMIAPPTKHTPPQIPTYGQYAVIMTWPGSNHDDVDLHVRSPDGIDTYFADSSHPGIYLENDVIPNYYGFSKLNSERVMIQKTETGEYVVNVHLYQHVTPGPVKVHVALWNLRGWNKQVVLKGDVVLYFQGNEHTMFRFTLDKHGHIVSTNHLQMKLVGQY